MIRAREETFLAPTPPTPPEYPLPDSSMHTSPAAKQPTSPDLAERGLGVKGKGRLLLVRQSHRVPIILNGSPSPEPARSTIKVLTGRCNRTRAVPYRVQGDDAPAAPALTRRSPPRSARGPPLPSAGPSRSVLQPEGVVVRPARGRRRRRWWQVPGHLFHLQREPERRVVHRELRHAVAQQAVDLRRGQVVVLVGHADAGEVALEEARDARVADPDPQAGAAVAGADDEPEVHAVRLLQDASALPGHQCRPGTEESAGEGRVRGGTYLSPTARGSTDAQAVDAERAETALGRPPGRGRDGPKGRPGCQDPLLNSAQSLRDVSPRPRRGPTTRCPRGSK